MALNKDTHFNASSVVTKETYELVKKQAKDNKRSISSQIAYAIEKCLEEEGYYGLESKSTK